MALRCSHCQHRRAARGIIIMTSKLALVFIVVLPIGADAPEDVKGDLKRLQGTWSTAKLHYNGKDYSVKYKFRFVIKGEQLVVEGNAAVAKEYGKIAFKLVPGANPKAIDLVVGEGTQKDAAIEGIYELKDDELTLCAKVLGKERPTTFASPDGGSVVLLVLKREKS